MKLTDIRGMKERWPKKSTRVNWYKPDNIQEALEIGKSLARNETLSEVEGIEIELDDRAIHSVIYDWAEEHELEIPPDAEVLLAKALCSQAKEIVRVKP
jgi:hypothetical protein